jgi:hypothetical protein
MMSAGWGVCWPLAGWLCCAVLCCAGGDRAPGLRCDAGGLGCADAGAGTGAPPPPRSVTRHLRRRQSKPTRHRPRPPPAPAPATHPPTHPPARAPCPFFFPPSPHLTGGGCGLPPLARLRRRRRRCAPPCYMNTSCSLALASAPGLRPGVHPRAVPSDCTLCTHGHSTKRRRRPRRRRMMMIIISTCTIHDVVHT